MAKRKGVYARDIDKLNIIFAAVAISASSRSSNRR